MQSTVKISILQNLAWKSSTMESYEPGKTAVWRAATANFIPVLERLKYLLLPEEIEKVNRFNQKADRQRFIISKAVLRVLLGRYLKVEPMEIRFKLGKNNKPELKNSFTQEIHFNVSHSGDWVLIAVSDNEVGVDVEKMNASFTYQNLLPFSFSKEESASIENANIPVQTFYQLWTRKESLLKATGKGLVDELLRVPSLTGVHQNLTQITGSVESWDVSSFDIDENHTGSVAFMPVKTALAFFNFQL